MNIRECEEKDNGKEEARRFLKEKLRVEGNKWVFRDVPVFISHRMAYQKLLVEEGRKARDGLNLLVARVRMVESEGLEHWFSEDMLQGIFVFLAASLKNDASEVA